MTPTEAALQAELDEYKVTRSTGKEWLAQIAALQARLTEQDAQIERCRKAVEPLRDHSGDWVDWVELAARLTDLYETWLAKHGICTGCGCGRLSCMEAWAAQRKCCPDCVHGMPDPKSYGTCQLKGCGGEIGPDVTGRPMCYRCGPPDMRPPVADP